MSQAGGESRALLPNLQGLRLPELWPCIRCLLLRLVGLHTGWVLCARPPKRCPGSDSLPSPPTKIPLLAGVILGAASVFGDSRALSWDLWRELECP